MNQDNHISFSNLNLQVYGHQVSGKTPKFTCKSQKFLYKNHSENQGKFFQYLSKCIIGDNSNLLAKYIPAYFGVFTQSQILHQEDSLKSFHDHSNKYNEQLEPVQEIARQQINHLNTTSERKEWIEHINLRSNYDKNQKFIKLKNLTYGFKYPNIMDIKLGIKIKIGSQKKLLHNTTLSHGFRINGLSVRQFDEEHKKDGTERFMSKYYCQKINQQQLNRHLAFFMFDGKKIHLQLLDNIIEHLKSIILGFIAFHGIKFMSSSLYLAYDAYDPKKYTINFIDFDKYQESESIDHTVEIGLKNCLKHLLQVKKQIKTIQEQLVNKSILYFTQNHDVIPQRKKQQFAKSKNLISQQLINLDK